jgi:lipopolysaccharide transport system ATP-binding protein
MSDTVIKIENVSKQYRLGEIGTGTISHDLNRWWARIRGKEDPFLKVGQVNDRTTKSTSDYVWALRDINAEIKKGEVWGVIGRNGAGKSTLLKILSQVTTPTTGNIYIKGKMASLLEVGTGFNGELTGRENVFLNGAILGMNRREIARKLDEIVEFAGVEKYIDTPLKRYSSGMSIRLAFAVAAHLDTDILILDEVLAVGDAGFQRKCLGKMDEVSKNEGKTILFVSHNLTQVQNLCKYGLLLENGTLKFSGGVTAALTEYVMSSKTQNKIDLRKLPRAGIKSFDTNLLEIEFEDGRMEIMEGESLSFIITVEFMQPIKEVIVGFNMKDALDNILVECRTSASFPKLDITEPGIYKFKVTYAPPLSAGIYSLSVGSRCLSGHLEYVPSVTNIEITPKPDELEEWNKSSAGIVRTPSSWELIK